MQTFLPSPSFRESAYLLDRQRLGKQRVENLQIMTALATGRAWSNHPATRMWRGYEYALVKYQFAMTDEWIDRGYSDTCMNKTLRLYYDSFTRPSRLAPPWLGDEEFHRSHQSNLIRKDAAHYGPLFPGVPDNLPYIWPV